MAKHRINKTKIKAVNNYMHKQHYCSEAKPYLNSWFAFNVIDFFSIILKQQHFPRVDFIFSYCYIVTGFSHCAEAYNSLDTLPNRRMPRLISVPTYSPPETCRENKKKKHLTISVNRWLLELQDLCLLWPRKWEKYLWMKRQNCSQRI